MAIHSYSQPSSSSIGSMSMGTTSQRRPREQIWGIPDRCVCGRWAVLKTSRTDLNPGRRFYGCEDGEDGGFHTFKWWDEAMVEEFQGLRLAIEDIRYARTGDCNLKIDAKFATMRRDIVAVEREIAELKKVVEEKKTDVFGTNNLLVVAAAGLVVICGMIIYFVLP